MLLKTLIISKFSSDFNLLSLVTWLEILALHFFSKHFLLNDILFITLFPPTVSFTFGLGLTFIVLGLFFSLLLFVCLKLAFMQLCNI